jgi:hypothetical protein
VTSRIRIPGIIAIIMGLLIASPRAPAADEESPGEQPPGTEPGTEPAAGPWQEGVSPADQDTAKALFAEAVTLQRQWLLADAAARYEQALARWEHPKIRFYLSRTQEKMGDPVAAYENLRLALRWGLDAFPPEDAEVAREMQRRLELELSRIEVRCDEPGAEVFVDGKPWFVGPGSQDAVVRPGEHAVIARKAGHFTVTRSISLVPGKHATVELGLSPETIVRSRWERWRPWHTLAVVGTGAALALAGGVLEWQAARDYAEYDRRFDEVCSDNPQCAPHVAPGMADRLRRARWENRGAIAAFGAAGATLAAGALLGWLDLPGPHRNEATGSVDVEFMPLVTGDATGVSLGGRF